MKQVKSWATDLRISGSDSKFYGQNHGAIKNVIWSFRQNWKPNLDKVYIKIRQSLNQVQTRFISSLDNV